MKRQRDMARGRGGPHCPAGFTLLELLVGIAVFAVMAGIVLGGIRLGVRSWDAAAERSEMMEEMRVTHALLKRQLASALPLATSRSGGWTLVFEGGPEEMLFISELPGYVSGGGVHYVSLEIVESGRGKDLLLKWRPLHALDANVEPDSVVIARDLERARLSYFGTPGRNAQPAWEETWKDARSLPQLVKLEVTAPEGKAWPDLVVPLEVNAVRFIASPEAAEQSPSRSGAVAPDAERGS